MEISSSELCRVCAFVSDYTVPIKEEDEEPTLLQRIKHEGSVLSLAMSDEYIFAGTQRNNILVKASPIALSLTWRFGISIRMNDGGR
jgi:hypothetical protein